MSNSEIRDILVKTYEVSAGLYKNFLKWMSQFAVFTGVLFVGYYNIDFEDNFLLLLVINALGLISSICWLLSILGYIRTTDKYNERISILERKLNGNNYRKYVYNLPELQKGTLSTKYCGLIFVASITIAWIVILLNNLNFSNIWIIL